MPAPRRPPLTDSPWFWAYVFATGGVIALILGTPRYDDRQEQIERQFLARQRAGQVVTDQATVSARNTESTEAYDETSESPVDLREIISLRPLWLLMTVILCVGWMVFWYQRRRWSPVLGPDTERSSTG